MLSSEQSSWYILILCKCRDAFARANALCIRWVCIHMSHYRDLYWKSRSPVPHIHVCIIVYHEVRSSMSWVWHPLARRTFILSCCLPFEVAYMCVTATTVVCEGHTHFTCVAQPYILLHTYLHTFVCCLPDCTQLGYTRHTVPCLYAHVLSRVYSVFFSLLHSWRLQ